MAYRIIYRHTDDAAYSVCNLENKSFDVVCVANGEREGEEDCVEFCVLIGELGLPWEAKDPEVEDIPSVPSFALFAVDNPDDEDSQAYNKMFEDIKAHTDDFEDILHETLKYFVMRYDVDFGNTTAAYEIFSDVIWEYYQKNNLAFDTFLRSDGSEHISTWPVIDFAKKYIEENNVENGIVLF